MCALKWLRLEVCKAWSCIWYGVQDGVHEEWCEHEVRLLHCTCSIYGGGTADVFCVFSVLPRVVYSSVCIVLCITLCITLCMEP
jgi:hypothetical protein